VTGAQATRGANIRPARVDDEEDWFAMWRDFTAAGPEPCAPNAAAAVWRRVTDPSDPMKCLVAVGSADRAVGFVLYLTHAYSWSARPVCYLLDLYVRPEARQQGLGRALIDALADIGRADGWLKIYWMAQADNAAAKALYDRVAARSPLVRYDLYLAPH
jgi:ribosomal protein S18 acetylase RimI-like enzyme